MKLSSKDFVVGVVSYKVSASNAILLQDNLTIVGANMFSLLFGKSFVDLDNPLLRPA